MSYKVKAIPQFEKSLKKLSKKYPSLKSEYIGLIDQLKEEPNTGVLIGKNCFKIRLAIKSKGKGKSGGARVITNFVISVDTVYLLSIYDKGDKESLTDSEIKELLKNIKH